MPLDNLKQYLSFTRHQRKGLFFLFTIIIALQLAYFFIDFSPKTKQLVGEEQWLALQTKIDSMKGVKQEFAIYPFNPNFITDYKGYRLGMSVEEINRLLAFRKEGKYVNSAAEFQEVTRISDSLLATMQPYFKFADWVNKKQHSAANKYTATKEIIVQKDINLATKEDLMKIYGIGEAISVRILKQRESLGGFVSIQQMSDVWGLSVEVIDNLHKYFKVVGLPNVKKIDINNASTKSLAQFPYFNYGLAKEIVTYRSMNGDIKSIEDLKKIKSFPAEKAEIIEKYMIF